MPKKSKKKASEGNVATTNRKARHNYDILESLEAGITLTGSEVKSLRQGRASLQGAFAVMRDGELYLVGMHIPQYPSAGYAQHDPTRARKLLIHKKEIRHLSGKATERGLTLIPLKCYFSHGLAKIELGIARGKRLYDKREDLKTREAERAIDRALRRRR